MNYESFFKMSYGLYVVSTNNNEQINGLIANAVFQVTAEPPRLAFACNKNNFTTDMIKKSGMFSISVLSQSAKPELIGAFGYKSGKDINKFSDFKYITGKLGEPVLIEDCVAYFECKLVDTFEVGTHLLFIGEIIEAENLDDSVDPITYAYYRTIKKGAAPANAPTYIDKSKYEAKPEAPAIQSANQSENYKCPVCGYIYDPAEGDEPGGVHAGTKFEDISEDWVCPICGIEKDDFYKV